MYEHLGFKLVDGKLVNLEPQVMTLDEVAFYNIGSHVKVVKPFYNDGRHGIIIELMFDADYVDDKTVGVKIKYNDDQLPAAISVRNVKYRIRYDDDQFPLIEGVWEHDDLEVIE